MLNMQKAPNSNPTKMNSNKQLWICSEEHYGIGWFNIWDLINVTDYTSVEENQIKTKQ